MGDDAFTATRKQRRPLTLEQTIASAPTSPDADKPTGPGGDGKSRKWESRERRSVP